MKYTIIFLLVLLFDKLSGQIIEKDYTEYHNKIIQIDNRIVNEQFNIADSLFHQLFTVYDDPFLADVIVAAQISQVIGNISHLKQFMNLAIENGATISCLKSIDVLENIPLEMWDKIERDYDLLRSKYFNKIDTVLYKQFKVRYTIDQDKKNSSNGVNVIENNVRFIHSVIKVKGHFPGEKMIGVNSNTSYCSFNSQIVNYTLYHYSYGFTEFEDLLYTAVKEGYMHPRQLAWLYVGERIYRKEKYGKYANPHLMKPDFPKYNFNFAFDYHSYDMNKVNADRAKFGICSYETDQKKLKLEKKYDLMLMIMPH